MSSFVHRTDYHACDFFLSETRRRRRIDLASFLFLIPLRIPSSHRMIQMFPIVAIVVVVAVAAAAFFSLPPCFFRRSVEQELIKSNTIILSTYLLLLFSALFRWC